MFGLFYVRPPFLVLCRYVRLEWTLNPQHYKQLPIFYFFRPNYRCPLCIVGQRYYIISFYFSQGVCSIISILIGLLEFEIKLPPKYFFKIMQQILPELLVNYEDSGINS